MLCQSKPDVDAVQALMSLAQILVVAGAEKVIICQLLCRASLIFRGLNLAEYNARVDQGNNFMGGGSFYAPEIYFWKHQSGFQLLGS
jgi:hypothetical protein